MLTVFSAPNYCDRYRNKAAVLHIERPGYYTVNLLGETKFGCDIIHDFLTSCLALAWLVRPLIEIEFSRFPGMLLSSLFERTLCVNQPSILRGLPGLPKP